jgi:hypothetical protein
MPNMRAKLFVNSVTKYGDPPTSVSVSMSAVTDKPYDKDGNSDDNTFAKYTPNASFSASINNPALIDFFTQGEKYYLDFTKAE